MTTAPEYVITVDDTGVMIEWKGETLIVEPSDLERGGWHESCELDHCDDGDCAPCDEEHLTDADRTVADIIRQWHDDNHEGVAKFCYAEPCKSLRDEVDL